MLAVGPARHRESASLDGTMTNKSISCDKPEGVIAECGWPASALLRHGGDVAHEQNVVNITTIFHTFRGIARCFNVYHSFALGFSILELTYMLCTSALQTIATMFHGHICKPYQYQTDAEYPVSSFLVSAL